MSNLRIAPIDGYLNKLSEELSIYCNNYKINVFIDKPVLDNLFLTLLKFSSLDVDIELNLMTDQSLFLTSLQNIINYRICFKKNYIGPANYNHFFLTKTIYANPYEWVLKNLKYIGYWYEYLPINKDFLIIKPIDRSKKIFLNDNFILLCIYDKDNNLNLWQNYIKSLNQKIILLNMPFYQSPLTKLEYLVEQVNINDVQDLMNLIRLSNKVVTDKLFVCLLALILGKKVLFVVDETMFKIKSLIIPKELRNKNLEIKFKFHLLKHSFL